MRNSYNVVAGIVVLIVIGCAVWLWQQSAATSPASGPTSVATSTSTAPSGTYGMSKYTDSKYGFTFWYPSALSITASTTQDSKNFPGGIAVETLQADVQGDTTLFVVNSPNATITDEPSGHASPISQTKYFYDNASHIWMTAFPDSASGGNAHATTTADVSKTTMSGLLMLASGRRFNTTIIPLSTTRFIVITDGGGSAFSSQLARTVAQVGVTVDPTIQATALQAEAAAYATQ